MKTRSQTARPRAAVPVAAAAANLKPLKTVALGPKPASKPKPRPKRRPGPGRKGLLEDPRRPKKPPTAFFYFLEDYRKIYQQENPNVKAMREIGKACGGKWKTMTFEEKVKYYDIATEKRAEFEKAMAEYIKKKESGEMSEESDDYDL